MTGSFIRCARETIRASCPRKTCPSRRPELVYGEEASWRDPVRYSFAFGGKDGVPFPVDRVAMDEAVDVLKCGIEASPVKREERMRAMERLRRCVPPISKERV